MRVVRAGAADADARARLRDALWPDDGIAAHRTEIANRVSIENAEAAAFVAVRDEVVVGFVEATIRHDHVNGCETSPVAFLEGIYVLPDHRGRGCAVALLTAVEDWARSLGMSEIGSDAELDNTESHALHAALRYEETERVVCFRKSL